MKAYDVIVAGGGIAGVTAAVASARNGTRTLIVERHNSLGGTMAAGLVGPMMTFHDQLGRQVIGGLAQEVVDRLVALGASPGHILDTSGYTSTITPFDNEYLKLVAQRMVLEAGAEILFQTYITDAIVDDGSVAGIVVENKGGRQLLGARVVVDATGDADVAARAGAEYMLGRPEDHLTQPASLMFRVSGVDLARLNAHAHLHPEDFRLGPEGAAGYDAQPLIAVCGFWDAMREARERGELHVERDAVLLFSMRPDEATINMSRVTRVSPVDPWALTRAETDAREQVFQILTFLRRYIPGMESVRLKDTGAHIGVRESRRIVGQYVLTGEDCVGARRFPDAVLRNAYPVDIHQPDGSGGTDLFLAPGETYTIPYRCLVPAHIGGLLAAGRCISTDHVAHASTRTSPTCMALGQAAGTAAALAVQLGVQPRNVSVDLIQRSLRDQGADLG
jgi:2-polyprenyl-6-methoxyphenol hydroxylase-like FAD-dependent oxidoreductase